ncbi:MAG: hypothetical protein V1809_14255 [Planctomycetota bacterium]
MNISMCTSKIAVDRFLLLRGVGLLGGMVLSVAASGTYAAPSKDHPEPVVSIVSPADTTATHAASIPITVHFRAKTETHGKKMDPIGHVKTVILMADGVEAGRYAPSAQVEEGDCSFTLALSGYPVLR